MLNGQTKKTNKQKKKNAQTSKFEIAQVLTIFARDPAPPLPRRGKHGLGSIGEYFMLFVFGFINQISPSWSGGFRRCDVDVEVLQVGFEGAFVVLTLASYFPATTTEFTVQQLLGYHGGWHMTTVPCPSCLSFANDGNDAGEVCAL